MYIPFISRRPLLGPDEQQQIVAAIQSAERLTSGEIRVFIERHCRYVDPLDRATEVFAGLKMEQTSARNGVLVYVALRDRQPGGLWRSGHPRESWTGFLDRTGAYNPVPF
ncbi:TPM domain-containing protein [Puia sp. P3]|uniref:TPM domain-containing protein n=1 Tax=Puia sp. P3 TaxID=3423952 RepID=UPI003D6753AE